MVFTTHLFIFYYLSLFLLLYYCAAVSRTDGPDRRMQLHLLRLGESALGRVDVPELRGRLRLRPGPPQAFGPSLGAEAATNPSQGAIHGAVPRRPP